jgi:serine/threonine protein kinase
MSSQKFGRYQILSEIGRGGMAQVFLADDPGFGRKVAVKVLTPQFFKNPVLHMRFEREARTIATLEHPAIVPVYDYGEQDGQLFLVMRYMPGGALSKKIQEGRFSLQDAIRTIGFLAPALDEVHRQGIVHRDIKPGNILYDKFGNPALSDFGIAQLSEATVELTGSAVIGTPSYMSPEQVRADADIDGRSDIYSLGIVFFEMLSGSQPYRSSTPMAVAMKHLTDPIPRILSDRYGLPSEIEPIIQKVLAKNREERYASGEELVADLQRLRDASPKTPDATQEESAYTIQSPRASPGSSATELESGTNIQDLAEPRKLSTPVAVKPVAAETRVDPGKPATSKKQPKISPTKAASSSRRPSLLIWGVGGAVGIIGLCLFLVLGGLAIRFGLMPMIQPLPQPSSTVLAPATEDPRTVLFSDDFTKPENGWPDGVEEGVEFGYVEEGYRVFASKVDSLYWASPDGNFGDASISTGATKVSGSDGSYYGIICRQSYPDHFYYFVIWGDGHFTIGKHKDGEFTALLPEGNSSSALIQKGTASNQLRADCTGKSLSLYINGEKAAEVEDDEFPSGNVGVAAAALDDQGLEVIFDRFIVREPANSTEAP